MFNAGDEAFEFIRNLPEEKVEAIDNYLYCKERLLDFFLEVDPWDHIDESSGRFDDESFRKEIKHVQDETDHYEKEFKSSTQRLKDLDIDPDKIDDLRLSIESLLQITETLRQAANMKTNNDMGKQEQDEPLRKLPILMIHDTEFYVDMAKLEFRQVDNPVNAISFRDVQDNGDHTAVMYDLKTKNAFKGTWGEMTTRQDVVLVQLPSAVDLDFDYVITKLNERSEQMFKQRQNQNTDGLTPTDKPKKTSRGQGL